MLSSRLPLRLLLCLAKTHRVSVPREQRTLAYLRPVLRDHGCTVDCVNSFARFRVHRVHAPLTQSSFSSATLDHFPPIPLNARDHADVVREWCAAFSPSELGERPCVVCGRLTLVKGLRSIRLCELELEMLVRKGEGVTRTERRRGTDPSVEVAGPVLYEPAITGLGKDNMVDICCPCANGVKRKKLPREALANGLWVGAVPKVLADANFLERLIMAKVRHNFFVTKVNKVAKVTVPSDTAGYAAYPVYNYQDIEISLTNIATYPDGEPPVCVVHHSADGELPAESLSVFDAEVERGTETGPCSFAVHGLTGTEYAGMTYDQKISTALRYFDNGGKVLAYGHEPQPESIYHNPALYPGMFPWLFPYGLGGFENVRIRTRLDRIMHVRHLLMYADRRFQTDECFPFMAFNHEQIRSSTHGGYLLTSRKNFPAVVDKIMNLNLAALDGLIERGRHGEYVQSQTEEEKRCFELMSIVDHVAGHVQGSATSRKYQRTEIKSLIIALGVPVFFITFAPVDIKHPLCLYYCGEEIDLMSSEPDIPLPWDCLRAIASNPVACARFFHVIVTAFIQHILRAGDDKPGLFGKTRSYYGTVESQGRLTLHLHLLLWIASCVSPQDIRDRVLNDPGFRARLVTWLESCQTGDYSNGDGEDVAARIEIRDGDVSRAKNRKMNGYHDPTTCMPIPLILIWTTPL
ncbi:hypothetical protein A0H81_02179 [Grifola frondosa]|uniref:Uncharacterized protein n=1 Tax=Grifola frondosa TaxID=5627 RepID=A0A1C7MLQ8_GRIFR|nr:hypothetical protein A0H81_02179 [Grifola frondosa]